MDGDGVAVGIDAAYSGGAHVGHATITSARWDELFPAEQARIVQLLVARIEVGVDCVNLRLRANGLTGLVRAAAVAHFLLTGGVGGT